MDKQLFQKVCDEIIGQEMGLNGIGTLGEKTVHLCLKNYLAPDCSHHEVKVDRYVADICNEHGIFEIQTRSFDKLRRKLKAFLAYSPVTIVYPIHRTKWIRWINPQNGEISPPRKSPKTGKPYAIFPELYKIKNYLTHPNLRIHIILMDTEEYRLLDGWSKDRKKGATQCDRIPLELVDEICISDLSDYRSLVPDVLEEPFTSKDYKKVAGISISNAQVALNILSFLGIVKRIGKKGNAYLYCRTY
ncbi:MAG: hypothetical protein GX359_02625 [Clostridiales bacterium]|nr:hypothetical protein [Clostridiales bacterium]